MGRGLILGGMFGEVAAVAIGTDEAVQRLTYTLNDTAADVLLRPALFYSEISGDVKVTFAGKNKTVGIYNSLELTAINAHIVKVWATGTALTTAQFRLYQ